MSYKIVADTAANLTQKFIKENDITVIPLSYHTAAGDVVGSFDENCDYRDFYDKLRSGMTATTSQINPELYISYFEPIIEKGDDILYIAISSGISGCISSDKIAAEELKSKYPDRKIIIVDSRGASLGIFLPIFKAVRNKNAGIDIYENAKLINELVPRIMQVFTVGDLMHLRRGGRVSGATAIIGKALGIKPLLKGDSNGKIVVCGKIRGRRKVIEELKNKYATLSKNINDLPVCISHCDCRADAEMLENMIKQVNPKAQIITLVHEPVTAIHLGPDSLALYFEGDINVREH